MCFIHFTRAEECTHIQDKKSADALHCELKFSTVSQLTISFILLPWKEENLGTYETWKCDRRAELIYYITSEPVPSAESNAVVVSKQDRIQEKGILGQQMNQGELTLSNASCREIH